MLRVVVIGMGPIGNLHARIYRTDPLAELVGVCDVIPERAEAASRQHGVPCFLNAQEMLEKLMLRGMDWRSSAISWDRDCIGWNGGWDGPGRPWPCSL